MAIHAPYTVYGVYNIFPHTKRAFISFDILSSRPMQGNGSFKILRCQWHALLILSLHINTFTSVMYTWSNPPEFHRRWRFHPRGSCWCRCPCDIIRLSGNFIRPSENHYYMQHSPSGDTNSSSVCQEISAFYETRSFSTVFTTARHWSGLWTKRNPFNFERVHPIVLILMYWIYLLLSTRQTVVGSRSPPLEVKVTPGQKVIQHFTPTTNLQNKKL
jgi:hypothetical protein